MKYIDAVEFLKKLHRPRVDLAIRKDLSESPEIFGHVLLVKGLYIFGRHLISDSVELSRIECDVILYNETDAKKIQAPEGCLLFRMRDLQEFPYIAAVKAHKPEPEK